MFYYKLNLNFLNIYGLEQKDVEEDLISPQWLRNIKDKKYPFYRVDAFFSKIKYTSIKFVDDGGWHFTNIKSARN